MTRSTGAVALILLTLVVVLGLLDVNRWSSARIARVVLDGLHRSAAMLVLVFTCLHVLIAMFAILTLHENQILARLQRPAPGA